MLAAIGDLVDDVAVALGGDINHAADTDARIVRRRGGSAANVAASAAQLGAPARFLGQVGADAAGDGLVADLADAGVDVTHVRRAGTSGTVVVLVEPSGERTMLTDRRACVGLDRPDRGWLAGVAVLHVPLYSLAEAPLSTTVMRVAEWCRVDAIPLSIDLSSTTVIDTMGPESVVALLERLRPAVVLANADEARRLGVDAMVAGALTVVKRGADPAVVYSDDRRHEVPAERVDGSVDTTGAGDAFAAGFLVDRFVGDGVTDDVVASCRAGHRAAADALRSDRAPRDL